MKHGNNKHNWRGIALLLLVWTWAAWSGAAFDSYPKIMFQRPAGISGGAIEHFMARYDLAIHGGAGPHAYALNDAIRALNPHIVILGTSRQGVWPGSFPPACFVYRPQMPRLTREAKPGDTEIFVTSTAGFPTRADKYRFAMIGGDEWFIYNDVTDTSFVGVITSGDLSLHRIHPLNDSLKTPVRFVGFGMLHNITPFAPLVGGIPVWKHFIDKRFEISKQDFSRFDGVFYDAFRFAFWREDISGGIDLDYNRVDDFAEHGLKWVNAQWADGVDKMLKYEREKLLQVNPGKPAVIATNTGAAEENYGIALCDGMMWEGFMRFASTWEEMVRVNRLWEEAHAPVYTMIEDYDPEHRRAYAKNKFAYMRYGLTTALMGGGYYGRTFGDYYYISLYYDEFDCDLGTPVSAPQKMSNGGWARFFQRGVAVCNPTGNTITVEDAHLRSLSGYAGPYHRLLGGQDPVFNNGERFTNVTLQGTAAEPPKYIKGDGIILVSSPDTVVSDIIVGNCYNNDTSPASDAVVLQGAWTQIKDPSSETYDATRNPCYSQWSDDSEDGIGYAAAYNPASPATATFTPFIGVAGYYEISEWHGWVGGSAGSVQEAGNVPWEIVVSGQVKSSGTINQRIDLGRWNRLGVVFLPAGRGAAVRISNSGADGAVIADAMRFRFLGQSPDIDVTPPAPPRNVRVINR